MLQRLKLSTEGVRPSVEGCGQTPAVIRNGPLELKTDISRAFWAGNQVDLTLTEFAIVLFLVSQQGGDVSYRQIYDIVRGKDFVAGYGPDGYRSNVRSLDRQSPSLHSRYYCAPRTP